VFAQKTLLSYYPCVADDPGTEIAHTSEIERRNACGSLSEIDRSLLRRSRLIRERVPLGATVADLSRELGDITRTALSRYINSPLHEACCRILDQPNDALSMSDAETAIRNAKQLVAMTLPEAVAYLRQCLEKDVATGYVRDHAQAMWATQELLKLGALKTGDSSTGGGVTITGEAMRALLGAIRGDDKARGMTATVTVVPTDG
jgi:hypothetical protein